MKQSQAERLNKVLKQDKSCSPAKILPSLKADLRDLFREYGELCAEINLEICDTENGYAIMCATKISRFKNYGNGF